MFDVAVVGAGAAGLTAAIFAARGGARVVAYDGAKKLGAKILISGGGRCNVTHDVVRPEDFNGNRNAIAKVLRSFTVEQTIEWFASMGVALKREETGKLFPVSDRAQTVLDALLRAARGIEIRTSTRVESLDDVDAARIILATGGRSVPKTGSDGGGYELARAAGHTVTPTFPGLVPLVIDGDHWIKTLSGTSADVELSVVAGRVVRRERGSMLLTHFGVSGPVVLDISRHWIAAQPAKLVANFLPGETFESADRMLVERTPFRLAGRLHDQLVPPRPWTRDVRRRVARDLTECEIPVTRDRGFNYAEVTAGGVPLSEVDLATMESRVRRDLYLCGEILDVDGRIGGYNFQWAWASGRLAGIGASR